MTIKIYGNTKASRDNTNAAVHTGAPSYPWFLLGLHCELIQPGMLLPAAASAAYWILEHTAIHSCFHPVELLEWLRCKEVPGLAHSHTMSQWPSCFKKEKKNPVSLLLQLYCKASFIHTKLFLFFRRGGSSRTPLTLPPACLIITFPDGKKSSLGSTSEFFSPCSMKSVDRIS